MANAEEASSAAVAGGPFGKPLKAADEFAVAIAERIRVSVNTVKIHKGWPFGWGPEVVGPLGRVQCYQHAADEAARELRDEYDLT